MLEHTNKNNIYTSCVRKSQAISKKKAKIELAETMVSEEAKKELYDVATKNDVETFQIIVQQHPFLVDHVSFPRSRSLLHLAAENGRVEIARELLSVAPEMRWWQDDQGMNPVHIAAMRGQVEILKLLLQLDLYPAMERLNRGQTVMHLCVKHRQLETLKCLVEEISDLVNVKDDDGDTLLHLAVRCDQVEVSANSFFVFYEIASHLIFIYF